MMNKSKIIPKSFELGGTTYNVELVDNSLGNGNVASIYYPLNKVQVAKNYSDSLNCTDEYKEISFLHELIHGILNAMGESEINNDERFIEGFANLLHQYIKTAKYE